MFWSKQKIEERQKEKEKRQKERKEYLDKVYEVSAVSLLNEDEKKQKKNVLGEVERLAKLVADASNSINVAKDCNKLLDGTRSEIEGENPDEEEMLNNLEKVKQRLLQSYDSRQTKEKWFKWLFLYTVVFFVGVGLAIGLPKLVPGQDNLKHAALVCLACALWGCIGGIVDAFVSMHSHFGKQDFDKHYLPWYCVHPFLGLALGAIVFLVMQAGLLAISGAPLQEATSANVTGAAVQNTVAQNVSAAYAQAAETGTIGASALPIALAFLAGFRQSSAVAFLTRIGTAIFQRGSSNTEAE